MSGVRLEVQWSPVHPNKFITWGTELSLYEVISIKEAGGVSNGLQLSNSSYAQLLATNSSLHYVKCVDIYPHSEPDDLLAIGQANGKVILTTFGPSAFDRLGLAGKELVPRHNRQCNTVAWSPVDSNLIAAGFDKYRSDHSVLLWDVQRCPHPCHDVPAESSKPVAELGLSDTAHALAWFRSQPKSLVVGMNNKQIKIFDLRDPVRVVTSTATKAVYGLVVDPNADNRIASYVDNQIFIWDTRNIEKPLLTLAQIRPVSKVLWCPTRSNLLGSLQRDSAALGLHDIQPTTVGNDEVEPSVLERAVHPASTGKQNPTSLTSNSAFITSFSWHPTQENRLLSITLSGAITDYTVFERITLNWSPSSNVVWTYGWRTLKTISDADEIYSKIDPDAVLIRRRALAGYGLKPELWENGEVAESDSLRDMWRWLQLSQSLIERGLVPAGPGSRCPGVKWLMRRLETTQGGGGGGGSTAHTLPWSDIPHCQNTVRVYRCEEREQALLLCGWNADRESLICQVEADGQLSRAAAISVFSLRLRQAVDILRRASNTAANYNIVALALSGFTDDKSSMWREQCQSVLSHLDDPYLRVMFAFLTSDNESHESVLNERGIAVEDLVAFACCFLSDARLCEYLKVLSAKLCDEGNLAGLLITGATSEAVPLLQRYLDVTGDIQTTSSLAARMFPAELLREDRPSEWITSYRNLLDCWRLWTQRAHFDIALNAPNDAERPSQQIFVSCNFCGKSISAFMQGRGRGFLSRLGATANKLKMSSCPNCRKPLPRCAICLMNMGTAAGVQGRISISGRNSTPGSAVDSGTGSDKLSDFSNWFTWCQSCRHGGHASHIMHWFSEHPECPVTACTCRCLSLDSPRMAKSAVGAV